MLYTIAASTIDIKLSFNKILFAFDLIQLFENARGDQAQQNLIFQNNNEQSTAYRFPIRAGIYPLIITFVYMATVQVSNK